VIFGTGAIIFFVLLQMRLFKNYSRVQWTNPNIVGTYCVSTIFSNAFALMIATYTAFALIFALAAILLLGIGIQQV
jgi:hypothetical protein